MTIAIGIDSARVVQLGYVGFGVSDLSAWRHFATGMLGLQDNGENADGSVSLRMDENHHRFILLPSGEDDIVVQGWEVKDAAALAEIADRVRAFGIDVQTVSRDEARARHVLDLVRFVDPEGLTTELYYGPLIDPAPFVSPRGIARFRTGSLGLGHIVLGVNDLPGTMAFYNDVLGTRLSDVIYMKIGPMTLDIHFLHANPRHHSLAIAQRAPFGPRINHFMIEALSLDDVGRTYELFQQRGISTGTLGRHTNDLMLSFYAPTPSGFQVEFGFDGLLIEDEESWQVKHHLAASSWGHARPQPLPDAAHP